MAGTHQFHAERVAFNEATFRRANEIVREYVHGEGDHRIPFICECGRAECLIQVELTVQEYESVRAEPAWFFVAPGHEIIGPDLGRLVDRQARYHVVEKVGVSGEIARARDPRSDGS